MRKSYSQRTQVQGDDHGILLDVLSRFGSSDRRDQRVSEIDGERVLRDEVDAVRDGWAEREEMAGLVSFLSCSLDLRS